MSREANYTFGYADFVLMNLQQIIQGYKGADMNNEPRTEREKIILERKRESEKEREKEKERERNDT